MCFVLVDKHVTGVFPTNFCYIDAILHCKGNCNKGDACAFSHVTKGNARSEAGKPVNKASTVDPSIAETKIKKGPCKNWRAKGMLLSKVWCCCSGAVALLL